MKRSEFLKAMAFAPLSTSAMKLSQLETISSNFTKTKKMPVLFIGHGHPMNAILNNDFTQTLSKLSQTIDKPNAVMVISAHWETVGTFVSTSAWPQTIYDFGRFDDRLFKIKYEPQGHPKLANELANMVNLTKIKTDSAMGLDHGAWTVLKFIYPKADIPVFQMSIDYSKDPQFHFNLAQQITKLREKGVLVLCSGNIVHNLGMVDWHNINAKPFDWSIEFDTIVKNNINSRNFSNLINYQKLGKSAQLAIPSNDHYLPLLYSLAMADKNEPIKHIFEGYQFASISMRCIQIG